eukprot:5924407-Pleurochrysis_carterae.AAC.1
MFALPPNLWFDAEIEIRVKVDARVNQDELGLLSLFCGRQRIEPNTRRLRIAFGRCTLSHGADEHGHVRRDDADVTLACGAAAEARDPPEQRRHRSATKQLLQRVRARAQALAQLC